MAARTVAAFIEETTDVVSGEGTIVCRDARVKRAAAAANFRRYDNLVYLVAGATAIALVIAIGLIVINQRDNGIATLVAGVVGGGATIWLVKLKNDAKKDELDAWTEVKNECRGELIDQDEAARLSLGLAQ